MDVGFSYTLYFDAEMIKFIKNQWHIKNKCYGFLICPLISTLILSDFFTLTLRKNTLLMFITLIFIIKKITAWLLL